MSVGGSLAGKPAGYLLVPDNLLVGQGNVQSVTSESGPFPGVAGAQTGNLGRLLPLQHGRLTASAADVVYRVAEAGGVDGAEFLWRLESETSSDFQGADDPRRFRYWHSPITPSLPGSDNCATVFARSFRTLISIGIDTSFSPSTVSVARRDVDATRYDQWTTTTFFLDRDMSGGDHGAALIELEDGRILMLIRVLTALGGATHDFDVYTSEDGGATFTRTARDVLFRSSGDGRTMVDSSQIRIARSGEHLRVCWAEAGAPAEIHSMYSTDRGATWALLTEVLPIKVGDTGLTDDQHPFDVVGVDDAGLFMIARVNSGIADRVEYGFARADADWSVGAADESDHTEDVLQIATVRTSSWVYVWVYWSDGSATDSDGWAERRARPEDVQRFVAGGWEETTPSNILEGAFFSPGRLDATYTGNEVFFYGARRAQVGGADIGRGLAWYWGGWSQLSFGVKGPTADLDTIVLGAHLFQHLWHIGNGRPTEGGGSPWSVTTTGTGADTSSVEHLEITGSAAGDRRFYRRTPGAGELWADGMAFTVLARLDTGDSTSAADNVALRIIGTRAGASVDVSLRISPTGITVFDNEAGSTLDTITVTMDTGLFGAFREVRLWMESTAGGAVKAQCTIIETDTETITKGAVVTLTQETGTPAANSRIDFGHLGQVQATTMRSWWRELGIHQESTAHQSDGLGGAAVNPDELFGWEAASVYPVLIEEGLSVTWAGVGAVIGDLFDGAIDHQHPAGAIALDSPQLDWRSGGTDPQVSQTLILDADPVDGVGRWVHDSISLYGTNDRTVLVDYDDNTGFSSPTATETLDTTAFTGQTVSAVEGTTLTVTGTPPWVAGECEGLYVRMTSGTAIDKTFKVTQHQETTVLHLDDETSTLAAQGVAAADTFVVYAPSAALEYAVAIGTGAIVPQRFMRLRFTDTDTAEGDHRLGTLVVGRKIPLDVPLEWQDTDDEQPNVSRYRSRSGVQWAFEEGPEARLLTSRFIGDRDRFRELLGHRLRQVGYVARPITLVRDEDRPVDAVLGRVITGRRLDNLGWYTDSVTSVRRQAGDLAFAFEEQV